jgi:hypothetical protein
MPDPAAELAKLGAAGPARVNAVERWLDATGQGALKSSLVTAAQVVAMEQHMVQQGAARFSQPHRVPPSDANKIPGFGSMTFEQKRYAQDQLIARRGRR